MSEKTVTATIGSEPTIDLIAGRHPNGELVIEKLLVNPQAEVRSFQLLKSPVFVRGIARADVIQQLETPPVRSRCCSIAVIFACVSSAKNPLKPIG